MYITFSRCTYEEFSWYFSLIVCSSQVRTFQVSSQIAQAVYVCVCVDLNFSPLWKRKFKTSFTPKPVGRYSSLTSQRFPPVVFVCKFSHAHKHRKHMLGTHTYVIYLEQLRWCYSAFVNFFNITKVTPMQYTYIPTL